MKKIFIGGSGTCGVHDEKNMLRHINYGSDWGLTDDYKEADLIILTDSCVGSQNTINVTFKYLDELLQSKKENAKIILSGCLANGFKYNLKGKMKETLDNFEIIKSQDIVNYVLKQIYPGFQGFEYNVSHTIYYHAAKVSPVSGCLNNCSFCKTNYLNFPLKSHSLENLKLFINDIDNRFRENNPINYMLCNSSNLSLYGKDLYGEQKAHEVIKLLTSLDMTKYAEVGAIINWYPELLKEILNNPKIKRVFTSLESGSQRVYDLMNRPIELDKLIEIIKTIKRERPDILIISEMIAGFPTETKDDLKKTINLFHELGISPTYIWPYTNSPYIMSNIYENYDKNYIKYATEYAKRKLNPLKERLYADAKTEAIVVEKNLDGYKVMYPTGRFDFINRNRLEKDYEVGSTIYKEEIKPKYLVKRNKAPK